MTMFLSIFLLAYLIGSIPFGLILVKLAGKGDIRKIGSGNIGATNVLRTGSKKLAALTLLLDGGKGAVAVVLGYELGASAFEVPSPAVPFECFAALAAILGHMFPVWLKFKGGKGVATAFGVFLALSWPIGLLACTVWLIAAVVFRYSSLAAILSMLFSAVISILGVYEEWFGLIEHVSLPDVTGMHDANVVSLVALTIPVIALLVILRHISNIFRLFKGTEPKIGKSKAEISNATP